MIKMLEHDTIAFVSIFLSLQVKVTPGYRMTSAQSLSESWWHFAIMLISPCPQMVNCLSTLLGE